MDVIINTTVLSNFASVNAFDLIKKLFKKVYTTTEVHEEILIGISRGYEYLRDVDNEMSFNAGVGWLQVLVISSPQEHILMDNLSKKLGLGEASCIANKTQNDIFE